MTRYFALALNSGHTAPKTRTVSARPKFDFRMKNPGIALMILLFILGVVYLLQINNLSTKGYEIKKLDQRLVELKGQSERLELEARALKAVETIQAQAKLLNLVPSRGVNYFPENDYAFKR